jgi:predicted transcriptional regulator
MSDITSNRFSDFDPNFILDTFLRCLTINVDNKMSISDFVLGKDIFTRIVYVNKININNTEFESIISKLTKDGNITSRLKQFENKQLPEYSLTFEGFVFLLNGSYSKAHDLAKAEELIAVKYKEDHDQSLKIQNSIHYMTFWIALGTVIPSIYYILQIYDGKPIEHPCISLSIGGLCLIIVLYRHIPKTNLILNKTLLLNIISYCKFKIKR